jgi:hypothetical protein
MRPVKPALSLTQQRMELFGACSKCAVMSAKKQMQTKGGVNVKVRWSMALRSV